MREQFAGSQGSVYFLLGDHLGSTSVTTSDTGVKLAEMKYKPWGEVRSETDQTPTGYTFTGQYSHTDDFGLMFFNARWYDPALGRFGQADSIIPNAGDPLAFDRYSYVRNSPASFVDPIGHYRAESEAYYQKPLPWWTPKPDDPVSLTTIPGQSGITGTDMYWMYQQYGGSLDLLLTEFWYREMGGLWVNEGYVSYFTDWAQERFLDWAKAQCSSATFNCFMNYLADYSQSAGYVFKDLKDGKTPTQILNDHRSDVNFIARWKVASSVVKEMKYNSIGVLDLNAAYDVGMVPTTITTDSPSIGVYADQFLFYMDAGWNSFYCSSDADWQSCIFGGTVGNPPNTSSYSIVWSYCQFWYWKAGILKDGCQRNP